MTSYIAQNNRRGLNNRGQLTKNKTPIDTKLSEKDQVRDALQKDQGDPLSQLQKLQYFFGIRLPLEGEQEEGGQEEGEQDEGGEEHMEDDKGPWNTVQRRSNWRNQQGSPFMIDYGLPQNQDFPSTTPQKEMVDKQIELAKALGVPFSDEHAPGGKTALHSQGHLGIIDPTSTSTSTTWWSTRSVSSPAADAPSGRRTEF